MMLFGISVATFAASPRQQLAKVTCAALDDAAHAMPGQGPMLLASYPSVTLSAPADRRALHGAAFVYDNAAAGLALIACGQPKQAQRIADALIYVSAHDLNYHDHRLRNAYAAGAMGKGTAKLPGFWNAKGGFWQEDAYQASTATGNMAWAALLALGVYQHTHETRYLDAARQWLSWIAAHTYDATAPAGYNGGVYGFDGKQAPQRWKSTEHNLDVYAAARWAQRDRPDAALARQARISRAFVSAMWDARQHHFPIGTTDNGHSIAQHPYALDAQVWPLLAMAPVPPQWQSVWPWIKTTHSHGAGFGYRGSPKGIWTEGTAQAAAAMQASGRKVPSALWTLLLKQRSADGLLYATPQARIETDLAIGPDSTFADFFYYHLPHLGATAWAALAAHGWNPFTGAPIKPNAGPHKAR
ncbi:hypothetical protein [Oleiagrimonas sp. C23AA]|uniref:hypothetical protein n=1 Tax=Oleiagrimonas sp. C23AA TaxID=2719047 RepID=UPI0019815980|nr:hypothetical protein [Oleiagrimonas sp. C23AA]